MRLRSEDEFLETHAMSRNVMNYVKWKHKAQKSKQYVVMATILLVASLFVVLLFCLLITGVIPSPNQTKQQIEINSEPFGVTADNQNVQRYMVKNTEPGGVEVHVLSYGASLAAIYWPDSTGRRNDVLLGYDKIEDYEEDANPPLGAVMGNFDASLVSNATSRGMANRNTGSDKVNWNATNGDDYVTFTHVTSDPDTTSPGLQAQVTYKLTSHNELVVTYTAETQGDVVDINMALVPYFNLAGEGKASIYGHDVTVSADFYNAGSKHTVNGTVYDLSTPTRLGDILKGAAFKTSSFRDKEGFDDVFYVRGAPGKRHAARVQEALSRRVLNIYTDQPALYMYTANNLGVQGKEGHIYGKHSAICLVSTNYPQYDSRLGDSRLYPGSVYTHTTWYKFSIAR